MLKCIFLTIFIFHVVHNLPIVPGLLSYSKYEIPNKASIANLALVKTIESNPKINTYKTSIILRWNNATNRVFEITDEIESMVIDSSGLYNKREKTLVFRANISSRNDFKTDYGFELKNPGEKTERETQVFDEFKNKVASATTCLRQGTFGENSQKFAGLGVGMLLVGLIVSLILILLLACLIYYLILINESENIVEHSDDVDKICKQHRVYRDEKFIINQNLIHNEVTIQSVDIVIEDEIDFEVELWDFDIRKLRQKERKFDEIMNEVRLVVLQKFLERLQNYKIDSNQIQNIFTKLKEAWNKYLKGLDNDKDIIRKITQYNEEKISEFKEKWKKMEFVANYSKTPLISLLKQDLIDVIMKLKVNEQTEWQNYANNMYAEYTKEVLKVSSEFFNQFDDSDKVDIQNDFSKQQLFQVVLRGVIEQNEKFEHGILYRMTRQLTKDAFRKLDYTIERIEKKSSHIKEKIEYFCDEYAIDEGLEKDILEKFQKIRENVDSEMAIATKKQLSALRKTIEDRYKDQDKMAKIQELIRKKVSDNVDISEWLGSELDGVLSTSILEEYNLPLDDEIIQIEKNFDAKLKEALTELKMYSDDEDKMRSLVDKYNRNERKLRSEQEKEQKEQKQNFEKEMQNIKNERNAIKENTMNSILYSNGKLFKNVMEQQNCYSIDESIEVFHKFLIDNQNKANGITMSAIEQKQKLLDIIDQKRREIENTNQDFEQELKQKIQYKTRRNPEKPHEEISLICRQEMIEKMIDEINKFKETLEDDVAKIKSKIETEYNEKVKQIEGETSAFIIEKQLEKANDEVSLDEYYTALLAAAKFAPTEDASNIIKKHHQSEIEWERAEFISCSNVKTELEAKIKEMKRKKDLGLVDSNNEETDKNKITILEKNANEKKRKLELEYKINQKKSIEETIIKLLSTRLSDQEVLTNFQAEFPHSKTEDVNLLIQKFREHSNKMTNIENSTKNPNESTFRDNLEEIKNSLKNDDAFVRGFDKIRRDSLKPKRRKSKRNRRPDSSYQDDVDEPRDNKQDKDDSDF